MRIITGAGWLVDMGFALILGSWFFDLFIAGHVAVAFAVGLVGAVYLMTMADEIIFQGTGEHFFE